MPTARLLSIVCPAYEEEEVLPLFHAAAGKLVARRPGLRVSVGRSPVVNRSVYDECARAAGIDVAWSDGSVAVLSGARAAEMIVAYRRFGDSAQRT